MSRRGAAPVAADVTGEPPQRQLGACRRARQLGGQPAAGAPRFYSEQVKAACGSLGDLSRPDRREVAEKVRPESKGMVARVGWKNDDGAGRKQDVALLCR